MLDKADIRERVIVLTLASTGMRIGGLAELKVGDLKKFEEHGLYMIWVYNTSKNGRYYTFATPEASSMIDEYLAFRKRVGEKVTDNSPLVRTVVSMDNPFKAQIGQPISLRTLHAIMHGLLRRTGLDNSSSKVMLTHGFRKHFATQCSRAGMDYVTREYLMGHRPPGLEINYNRMTEEDRLVEYLKCVDMLTISKESHLARKVKELESEQMKTMQEYHDEWLINLQKEYSIVKRAEYDACKLGWITSTNLA